jgi:uncharacterized protein YjiS (DUF1127 family)
LHTTHFRYANSRLLPVAANAYLSAVTENRRKMEGKMNLIRSYKNWRRFNQTVRELSRLSNRQLDDLGVTRADIARIARGE